MNTLLSDSINDTLDKVAEALRRLRPDQREQAKDAAVMIERVIMKLRADHPRNPAIALGVVFAVYKMAERFLESDKEAAAKSDSMINLLS